MSSTTNISLFGAASPNQVAIWISGVALILLLGAIIAKAKGSSDLRFLTCCVLVGVFGILGFAYFSSDGPTSTADAPLSTQVKAAEARSTDGPRLDNKYPGDAPNYSSQNAKPAGLPPSSARSGAVDQPLSLHPD